MCGIFCLLSEIEGDNPSQLLDQLKLFEVSISRRGPNAFQTKPCKSGNFNLLFASSVLWLQGNEITRQPLEDDNSIFVYNGDVFGGNIPDGLRREEGDTRLFLRNLKNPDAPRSLEDVQGPYAFIYLNIPENRIYFGRDVFGRRSLLIGRNANQLVITSVAKRGTNFDFIELPSIGTFSIDLTTKEWRIYPWREKNKNFGSKLEDLQQFLNVSIVSAGHEYAKSRIFTPPTPNDLRLIEEAKTHVGDIFNSVLRNPGWLNKVIELNELLEVAVRKRISTQPSFCQNCYDKSDCGHCLTGVLFSGGVDCAILALLADKCTDESRPIDLINVAFDRVKDYKTPDRLTAIGTYGELRNLRPSRKWNFVEVDVTGEELNSARSEAIADLIYPLNTVLDDSLGCALWFASRARSASYTSPCRVLLVGMGADELFGGYTRHRAALKKGSWEGLHEVLNEDWQNLSHRNLARDDRVVSDHGRQLRTPYLDEDVVDFVRNLDSWEKSWPSGDFPQGIGEKILLRSLAHRLGLKNAATFKKRALQFGSRIANPKENAHEVSLRL